MSFHDVQFPTNISTGSRFGPGFSTSILEGDAGAQEAVLRWPNARRKFNARYGIRKQSDLRAVIDFFIAREGSVHGFRFKDPMDFTTAADHVSSPTANDVILGTASGTGDLQWQLKTKYTSGPTTIYRAIEKPIVGTVLVAKDGTPTTGFTLDSSTGVITLSSVSASQEITAGCEFDVPCQFGPELANEAFQASIDNYESGDLPDIPIVEMLANVASSTDFNWGHADYITTGAPFFIEYTGGRLVVYNNNTSVDAYLPDPDDADLGGWHFEIVNLGTGTITLKDHTGTSTIKTVATTKTALAFVYNNGSANVWHVAVSA